MKALLLILLCIIPVVSWADTTNPRFFNFQSVMRGDNGELVTDPFIDLEFQITDAQNQVLYSEQQKDIQVIRGAVNVLVGEGTLPGTNQLTGGLPAEIFDPRTGSKFLRFQVGANLMGDGIELVSMPYAYWSEQALHVVPNAIGSEEIKDGSIELKDLARSIQFSDVQGSVTEAQVPTTITTDVELAAHQKAKLAHKASQISVEGPYMAYPAKNVEEIIKALDEKVYLYKVNGKEDVAKATNGATGALGVHVSATLAHGSDGTVVGKNTLDASVLGLQGQINTANTNVTTLHSEFQAGDSVLQTQLAAHALQTQGVHGLTSADPSNAIVGTTETQTLTNKILENPILNGGSLIGDANTLIDLGASIGDGKGLKLPQDTTNPPNSNNLVGLLFWDTDDGLLKVSTGAGWLTAGNPFGASVDSGEISDDTLTNSDIAPTAGIVDTKLATITTAGKVADSALSGNVTKLGGSIESGEITDGTITDADLSPTAGIVDTKLATIVSAGKVADTSLSATVTKLGQTIESGEITDGTITDADISATAAIADTKLATIATAGKVADSALSANVTKLGQTIESAEITDSTITNADISGTAAIADTKLATISSAGKVADTALSANVTKLGNSIESGEITDGTIQLADLGFSISGWDTNASDDITTAGGTITGNLQVNGNIGVSGTVDGVDVSFLNNDYNTKISNHETRLKTLEGGQVTNLNQLSGQVSDNQVPQYMRPAAFGVLTLCSGSNNLASPYNTKWAGGNNTRVDFISAIPTPYVLVGNFATIGQDADGFQIQVTPQCNKGGGSEVFSFAIFKN